MGLRLGDGLGTCRLLKALPIRNPALRRLLSAGSGGLPWERTHSRWTESGRGEGRNVPYTFSLSAFLRRSKFPSPGASS